jgi:hypothetical protein
MAEESRDRLEIRAGASEVLLLYCGQPERGKGREKAGEDEVIDGRPIRRAFVQEAGGSQIADMFPRPPTPQKRQVCVSGMQFGHQD